jgi:Tfp pilus assembly protein PilF
MIPPNAFKITCPGWRSLLALAMLGIGLTPALADSVLDEAGALLKSGKADAAESVYRQYLRTRPGAVPARLALAEIALRRDDYATAQSLLDGTLARHPRSPEAAALLGALFIRRYDALAAPGGDAGREYLARAGEVLERARTMMDRQPGKPPSPAVLTQLAEWELRQNDMVSAERHLQSVINANPAYVPAFQGLLRFHLKTGDLRRANDAALHALDLDPDNSLTHFLIARMLGLSDQPAEAVRYALKSEKLDYGRMPERDAFLAAQYEKLGEPERALPYYQARLSRIPGDTQSWLRLGELRSRLGPGESDQGEPDPGESRAARQAMALHPDVLAGLQAQAREDARSERPDRIERALAHWRRILDGWRPGDTGGEQVADEARGAIAGLRLRQRLLNPKRTPPDIERDRPLLQELPPQADALTRARNALDRAKLTWALQGEMAPEVRQALSGLSENADPAIAGEAAFLLEDLERARIRLDEVDGLSAEEYTRLADRLLLDQELVFSRIFYERAAELNHDASLPAAISRVRARQAHAAAKVAEGNTLFNARDYTGALERYRAARVMDRQSDTVYLRLGDTYEKLRQWPEAYQAYHTAVALSPSLLNSPGFKRHYDKLARKGKASSGQN